MGPVRRLSIAAAVAALSASGCRCGHTIPPDSLSFHIDGQLVEALQVTESQPGATWQLDAALPGSGRLRIVVTLVGWPGRGASLTFPLGPSDPAGTDYAELRLVSGTFRTGADGGSIRLYSFPGDCLPCEVDSPAGPLPVGECPHTGYFDLTLTGPDGATHRISKGKFSVW